jgi:hypothetical protein
MLSSMFLSLARGSATGFRTLSSLLDAEPLSEVSADQPRDPLAAHRFQQRKARGPHRLAEDPERAALPLGPFPDLLQEAHGAEIVGLHEQDLALLQERQLARAAADVQDHGGAGQLHLGADAERDQAGLLGPGDHLEIDAGLLVDPVHERGPVLGLAGGARGHGSVEHHAVLLHEIPEAAERLDRALHGLRVDPAVLEDRFSQADRDPLPLEDLVPCGALEFRDGDPHRVAAHVHPRAADRKAARLVLAHVSYVTAYVRLWGRRGGMKWSS